eukprot:6182159-Pleurochrysis_carterae.AAC.4
MAEPNSAIEPDTTAASATGSDTSECAQLLSVPLSCSPGPDYPLSTISARVSLRRLKAHRRAPALEQLALRQDGIAMAILFSSAVCVIVLVLIAGAHV